jgi:hypothetical protein
MVLTDLETALSFERPAGTRMPLIRAEAAKQLSRSPVGSLFLPSIGVEFTSPKRLF